MKTSFQPSLAILVVAVAFWMMNGSLILAQDRAVTVGAAPAAAVTVVADPVGNNLIVSAPEEILKEIAALVEQLDVPSSDEAAVSRVFFLKNSKPNEMATELNALFSDPNMNRAVRKNADRANDDPPIMTKVVVVAVPRTNALIVSSSSAMMDTVARLIEELDASPWQDVGLRVIKPPGSLLWHPWMQGRFSTASDRPVASGEPLPGYLIPNLPIVPNQPVFRAWPGGESSTTPWPFSERLTPFRQ